mgnify:CR=1 FL=1
MKLSKKDLRPVQGPSETAPSLHKCCSTEAARAVAERNEWTFDGNDHVCDKNGQRICDSVEALAEKLTQARFITNGSLQRLCGNCPQQIVKIPVGPWCRRRSCWGRSRF